MASWDVASVRLFAIVAVSIALVLAFVAATFVLLRDRRALEIQRQKAGVASRAKTAFMATMVCVSCFASCLAAGQASCLRGTGFAFRSRFVRSRSPCLSSHVAFGLFMRAQSHELRTPLHGILGLMQASPARCARLVRPLSRLRTVLAVVLS